MARYFFTVAVRSGAQGEIDCKHYTQHSHGNVRVNPQVNPVSIRDLDGLQAGQDPAELEHGDDGYRGADQDEGNADPQRGAARQRRCFARLQQQAHEKPETLDDEAERHQGQRRAIPREQRPLGGEEHPRIVEIRHPALAVRDRAHRILKHCPLKITGPVGAPLGEPPAGSTLIAIPHASPAPKRLARSALILITWLTSVLTSPMDTGPDWLRGSIHSSQVVPAAILGCSCSTLTRT